MGKKKLKLKKLNLVLFIFIWACIFGAMLSLYHILMWKLDGDSINDQLDEIERITEVVEVDETSNNIEIIEQKETVDEFNPYWEFMKMNLISVDFADLKEANSDTVGWIQVNGTNINYPFVQTDNNTYYLKHSFNKSYNSAGWIFLDYRNSSNLEDRNNILYAHGRLDNTMFGSLRNTLTNGWLDNKSNYVFKTSTLKENSMWQVFSVYKIPVTSDYIKVDFKSDEEFLSFAKMLIDRSAYDFKVSVSEDDKILTLSTCYDDKYRMVLHAKLIKREKR